MTLDSGRQPAAESRNWSATVMAFEAGVWHLGPGCGAGLNHGPHVGRGSGREEGARRHRISSVPCVTTTVPEINASRDDSAFIPRFSLRSLCSVPEGVKTSVTGFLVLEGGSS